MSFNLKFIFYFGFGWLKNFESFFDDLWFCVQNTTERGSLQGERQDEGKAVGSERVRERERVGERESEREKVGKGEPGAEEDQSFRISGKSWRSKLSRLRFIFFALK